MKTVYLLMFLFIIIAGCVLELTVDFLRIRSSKKQIPDEFKGYFDEEKQQKYREYKKKTSIFSIFSNTVSTFAILAVIIFGGLNFVDIFARNFKLNEVFTGVIFFFSLFLISSVFNIPFSYYSQFKIENDYGFNKTTRKTFILDLLKGLLLSIVIGIPVTGLVLFCFIKIGNLSWLIAWGAVTLILFALNWVFPVVISPLFNKFTPVENEELEKIIFDYAKKFNFSYSGVYKMDGSKRTTKPNAYFAGFGKTKRIVLYDTLLEKLDNEEILTVLGHEMGHYKKKHILSNMLLMSGQSFLMFFLLYLFIRNPYTVSALGLENFSIYGAMTAFAIVYMPLSLILSVLMNFLSRKFEYQADRFAVESTGKSDIFIEALKKIHISSFGNLTPHFFDVLINYNHPPVIKRIEAVMKTA
ncbi:M48 family metallopeptidase [candidate division WOR-3 bacterium]|nr:M48 family metallopeptidase [candidate division WOR-3 bacterium]